MYSHGQPNNTDTYMLGGQEGANDAMHANSLPDISLYVCVCRDFLASVCVCVGVTE